jgi:hypothetical protein
MITELMSKDDFMQLEVKQGLVYYQSDKSESLFSSNGDGYGWDRIPESTAKRVNELIDELHLLFESLPSLEECATSSKRELPKSMEQKSAA